MTAPSDAMASVSREARAVAEPKGRRQFRFRGIAGTFRDVGESLFDEMKRYVRFRDADGDALRTFYPKVAPAFTGIIEDFYLRLSSHQEARQVLGGPEQVESLKRTLRDWLDKMISGPWDDAYYRRILRIGSVHVRIGLPQRYMFGAMNSIHMELQHQARAQFADDVEVANRIVDAVAKIVDVELAVMLETYRDAYVERVQRADQLEKVALTRRLKMTEARYEAIVEQSEALITTNAVDGTVLLFNQRCEAVTGLSREAVEGKNWIDLFASQEDRSRAKVALEQATGGAAGVRYEGVVPNSEGAERWVRWHFAPLPDEKETLVCAIGLDVTEERDLEGRTRRAEHLASLGTMAAGLAHEIRNPLNAAHLQLTLVRRRLARPNDPDIPGAMVAGDLVHGEMKRLASLVDDFLQFARPQPLVQQRGDLFGTVKEVVNLLAPEVTDRGAEMKLSGSSVVLPYDEEKIKQVVLNLLRNAAEAAGNGGHVNISVEQQGARFARLQVEDDGTGLDDDDNQIFEPFFTTKEGGTGLGLSIVHRIVTDHDGSIDVSSRAGRTLFTVLLPMSGAQ